MSLPTEGLWKVDKDTACGVVLEGYPSMHASTENEHIGDFNRRTRALSCDIIVTTVWGITFEFRASLCCHGEYLRLAIVTVGHNLSLVTKPKFCLSRLCGQVWSPGDQPERMEAQFHCHGYICLSSYPSVRFPSDDAATESLAELTTAEYASESQSHFRSDGMPALSSASAGDFVSVY